MCKLTIIVPVYNTSTHLKKCIDSLLVQKMEEIEILLINDGSTDNSGEILAEYAKRYPKQITYYKKENTGVADTRNFGISKANGRYILFVDSDDYIKKDLLEQLQKYIDEDIDIIKFKAEKVDTHGKVLERVNGPIFDKTDGQSAFNTLYFTDVLLDSPCVYLLKKELFEANDLKFKLHTEHEDFGLIPLMVLIAKTFVSTDIYGYCYVQTNNSITRNNEYKKTIKKFEDSLLHYDNMLKFINKFELRKKTEENVKIYYTNAILLKLKSINAEDRKEYIKQIKKRKMIKNIKIKNTRQLIKKLILSVNINWYLKIIENGM